MKTSPRFNLIAFLIVTAAACLLGFILENANGQTTQPTTQPTTLDGLLSQVSQPTQTQIRDSLASAHVDPTTVPAISFVAEGDATAALNSLKPAASLYLKPLGSYQSNTANITGAGAHIVGDNTLPAGIKINKTGMAINAAGVEISGIGASGFAKFIQANKPGLHVHDCIAASLSQFLIADAGADNFVIENVTGSKIGGNFIYVVASHGVIRNVVVSSMTSPASEYCVRTEVGGPNNSKVCTDLLIDRCDFTNDSTSGKPALGAREYQDLSVSNSTFRPWIRFGQDGAPANGAALKRATLKDCIFPGGATLPKGGTIIDVKDGCDVTLDGATFGPFTNARQSCVHVKGSSTLRYRNLTVLGSLSVPIISSDPGAAIIALP